MTPRDAIDPASTSLTFAKGLAVLKCFDAEAVELSVPEIATRTGLDRAVVRRLVLTLVQLGYVQARGRSYALAPRILVLAGGFLQGRRFGMAIQPVMEGFAAQLGEPLSMAMRDGDEAIYVAHAGGEALAPRLGFTVGSRVPLLSTAIGRALLAQEDPPLRTRLVNEAPLRAWTDHTETDRARLAALLGALPAGAIVTARGEFEPGIAASALGFQGTGGEIAAVGHSSDAARYEDPAFRARLDMTLQRAAAALRGLL
ncbi:MAG: helix-turn-helix domain-containing protein [Paracoccaceae bacterium]